MTINVTKRDIARARRLVKTHKQHTHCPIALAAGRKGGNASVGLASLSLDGLCFKMPEKAQNFVSRFDDGKRVKPFKFSL